MPKRTTQYDDPAFFAQYGKMPRSLHGLAAAGEWHALKKMLPDLRDKRVLDLGCGYGWHCRYAAEQGAREVVGLDLSEKMLAVARQQTPADAPITYVRVGMEDIDFTKNRFDEVISSLALHYVEDLDMMFAQIARYLRPKGHLVFSIEHPVFTAQGSQEWHRDPAGQPMHWPVDNYFAEGRREACFLGQSITKYHRTLTSIMRALKRAGFQIQEVVEPEPDPELLKSHPEWRDELRRPMMMLVSAINLSSHLPKG